MKKIRLNPGDFFVTVDVELYWRSLLAKNTRSRLEAVAEVPHWDVVLPEINMGKLKKAQFLSAYSRPKALTARRKALDGLVKGKNFRFENEFIREIRELDSCWVRVHELDPNRVTVKRDDGMGIRFFSVDSLVHLKEQEILEKLVNLVRVGDYKSFQRIADILKKGGCPVSDSPRGGEWSEDGRMIREFVLLHLGSKGLPTKWELREKCGLTCRAEDGKNAALSKIASKAMKRLGLSGLPKGRSGTD